MGIIGLSAEKSWVFQMFNFLFFYNKVPKDRYDEKTKNRPREIIQKRHLLDQTHEDVPG